MPAESRGVGKPLALLSAVTHLLRTTLRSVQIAEKSNEIPAITPLLAGMNLEGSLITADAMHCQQESARLITQDLGADYIVGHWDAIENGTHRVRDVSMGEDACRVAHPKAARNTVSLRNLANGLYNLLLFQKKIQAPSLPSWRRSMTNSQALKHVLR